MVDHHPFSLKYCWLKARILLIRCILWFKVRALRKKLIVVPGVEIIKLEIPSRDVGRSIPAYLYRPDNVDRAVSLPVHLNLHGGGYCIPMHGYADEGQCRHFSKRLQVNVLDVGYRVSPEHPFPASLEDTIDSILWIHSNPSLYNFNIKKVSCGGNSAGAGLALSASHSLGPERICALALLYPPCDFSKMDPNEERLPPSKTFRSGFKLDHKAVLFLEECYLLDNVDRKDPKLNPMYANTMDFPKRIILATGTGDPIYNEDEAFIKKLTSEGHQDATLVKIPGEGHAWDKIPQPGSISEQYKEEAYEALCQCIERGWKDCDEAEVKA